MTPSGSDDLKEAPWLDGMAAALAFGDYSKDGRVIFVLIIEGNECGWCASGADHSLLPAALTMALKDRARRQGMLRRLRQWWLDARKGAGK